MASRIPLLRRSLLRPLPLLLQSHKPTPLSNSVFLHPPKAISSSSHPNPSPFPHLGLSSRPFSSSFTGPSNIVLIHSEQEFSDSLKKVEDEGLHAIFYFTAVWCGPCKFVSPVIEEMSVKFPQVTTYKIDIDQDGLGSTLNKLKIYSVNGKKVDEVIGADVKRLKDTMESLYKVE